MDAFWPNSSHEAARNCLNVAVHGLRRALRAAVDVPVVVQVRGTYLLHPNIWLWLDVEEFEHHVARGRELEESDGDPTRATAELDLAASLYQGDFLADHPYEEWSVLNRERLRLAYLDTLTRLSRHYLNMTNYATCAVLCRLISGAILVARMRTAASCSATAGKANPIWLCASSRYAWRHSKSSSASR